jgi:hypothetical protein
MILFYRIRRMGLTATMTSVIVGRTRGSELEKREWRILATSDVMSPEGTRTAGSNRVRLIGVG